MTHYVIPVPETPSLAVAGSALRFPIRRVFCVGRNYAAHAREFGNNPDRDPPFFFTKPADAVVPAEGTLVYPTMTDSLHHEIELVVAIGKGGSNVSVDDALGLVWGYGVGLDMTRRDLQDVAKKMARPWDMSKGFDASAPCTPLIPAAELGHPSTGRIWLDVNGKTAQEGDLADLIWPIADMIADLSRAVRLEPGDLIFSGTPAGVGALNPGDKVHGGVAGVAEFDMTVGAKP